MVETLEESHDPPCIISPCISDIQYSISSECCVSLSVLAPNKCFFFISICSRSQTVSKTFAKTFNGLNFSCHRKIWKQQEKQQSFMLFGMPGNHLIERNMTKKKNNLLTVHTIAARWDTAWSDSYTHIPHLLRVVMWYKSWCVIWRQL